MQQIIGFCSNQVRTILLYIILGGHFAQGIAHTKYDSSTLPEKCILHIPIASASFNITPSIMQSLICHNIGQCIATYPKTVETTLKDTYCLKRKRMSGLSAQHQA